MASFNLIYKELLSQEKKEIFVGETTPQDMWVVSAAKLIIFRKFRLNKFVILKYWPLFGYPDLDVPILRAKASVDNFEFSIPRSCGSTEVSFPFLNLTRFIKIQFNFISDNRLHANSTHIRHSADHKVLV